MNTSAWDTLSQENSKGWRAGELSWKSSPVRLKSGITACLYLAVPAVSNLESALIADC